MYFLCFYVVQTIELNSFANILNNRDMKRIDVFEL